MQQFGSNELMEDVINRGLCVGCGMCVDLCPYFKSYLGKTSRLFACDLKRGRCYAYCPKAEVDLDELSRRYSHSPYEGLPIGLFQRVVMSRAGAKAPKGRFQGGGSVSAIVAHALTSGSIEAAVLTGHADNEMTAEPIIVTDPGEVVKAAGSKFMAAPTLSALNRASRQGLRNIGVVGTPCQMTAIAQMRCNPLDIEEFIDPVGLTVGLFCTWALDTRKLLPLIADCLGDACILSMDVPPPPAEIMTFETSSGRAEIPLARIRPIVPRGCLICPDMTNEWADISVGQIEGRAGWNTLIVRNAKGNEAVKTAVADGFLEVRELPEGMLHALEKAGTGKKARALKTAANEGVLNTPEDKGRAALRIPSSVVAKITGVNA